MRALLFALAFAPLAVAADPPAVKDATPFAAAWQDMLSADEAKATRAACLFVSKPKEGVEFIASKLNPVKADPKRLEQLTAELGDKDFATRDAAQQELDYLGKFAKADLEKALKTATNAEAKERLTKLLGRIEAYDRQEKIMEGKAEADPVPARPGRGGGVSVSIINGQVMINGQPVNTAPRLVEKIAPPSAWTRAARAIGVLEFVGTPEAVKLLEAVSLGEDNAPPTKLAQDALARLKRKK